MRASILGALAGLCAAGGCRQPAEPPPLPDTRAFPPAPVATESATSATSVTAGAAAPPRPALSREEARAMAKRASACLDDPRCRLDEAQRLHAEAVERGALEPDCFDLYYGVGTAANPARARACFERTVAAEKPCGGGSPSLERSFLGLMLADAQGGPRERARAEALFAGCLSEGGLVIGAAERREQMGGTTPIDFCADIFGTTLDQTECARIDGERAHFEAQTAAKDIFAELAVDDAGFALWSQARDAWATFASRDASYANDLWRGGTGAPTVYELSLVGHTRERLEVLRGLLIPADPPDPPAEAALKAAETSAGATADAQRKKLLADAQAAWRAYRAAETTFVRRAFAAKYGGGEAAARAVGAVLARRRAAALGKAD